MRLCLDEDLRSRELRRRIRTAGHEVVDPEAGRSDPEVWEFAQRESAVVVTGNAVDFVPLAQAAQHHAGLLLVYRENDPQRDMTAADIATAISNVDAANDGAIDGLILVLNQFFRWFPKAVVSSIRRPAVRYASATALRRALEDRLLVLRSLLRSGT